MTMNGRGRGGRKRKNGPNISQRPGKSISPLPAQYNLTPTAQIPPVQSPAAPQVHQPSTSAPDVRSYPPPQQLFQTSSNPVPQVNVVSSSHEVHNNPQASPRVDVPPSPLENSRAPSSQGNNFEDVTHQVLPDLDEETIRDLNALLLVPGREKFTTVLNPEPEPNTQWFTRDIGSKLVQKITKVFTNKFEGPYYSWSRAPRDKRQRMFLEFAKTHTWDPLITGSVQECFEEICQRRMKGMVSDARTSGERPDWITDTIWQVMTANRETPEQQAKSTTYSACRLSERNGLGPHKHLSGPTSYAEIQQALGKKLGREATIGEVFIKTHTKPDGTYVDRKAEKIARTYEMNVQEKLSQLQAEISDGASPPLELTTDDYTDIILQSTEVDSRGNPYGVGSLKQTLARRKNSEDSCSFSTFQQQLKEAQRKFEEQAAYNERCEAEFAAREEEQSRVVAEQKEKLEHLSLLEQYLRQTDPKFQDFMATHSAPNASNTAPISTSVQQAAPGSTPGPT